MRLKMSLTIVILFVILITRSQGVAADNEDTLELLQVLVRHGNRTSFGTFPQFIPEYIETFHPFEFAQLTPGGRQEAYKFGQFLRNRYDAILPDEFSYTSVALNCSQITRCVETGLVAMSAIFPPKKLQKWGDSGLGELWTPIVCYSVPKEQDVLFEPDLVDCPRFQRLLDDVVKEPKFVAKYNELTRNGSVISYIQRSLNMSTSEPLSEGSLETVYENLFLLENSGLPLPEWSKAVYPSPLREIDFLGMWKKYGSRELLKFSIGEYVREIIKIAEAAQARTLRPLDRKLFISFAHDTTIMPLLVALGLETHPTHPGYAAAVIMEMHRIPETQEIGFKFVYRNSTWRDPIIYKAPGCGEICPLATVKKLVEDVIPPKNFYEMCADSED